MDGNPLAPGFRLHSTDVNPVVPLVPPIPQNLYSSAGLMAPEVAMVDNLGTILAAETVNGENSSAAAMFDSQVSTEYDLSTMLAAFLDEGTFNPRENQEVAAISSEIDWTDMQMLNNSSSHVSNVEAAYYTNGTDIYASLVNLGNLSGLTGNYGGLFLELHDLENPLGITDALVAEAVNGENSSVAAMFDPQVSAEDDLSAMLAAFVDEGTFNPSGNQEVATTSGEIDRTVVQIPNNSSSYGSNVEAAYYTNGTDIYASLVSLGNLNGLTGNYGDQFLELHDLENPLGTTDALVAEAVNGENSSVAAMFDPQVSTEGDLSTMLAAFVDEGTFNPSGNQAAAIPGEIDWTDMQMSNNSSSYGSSVEAAYYMAGNYGGQFLELHDLRNPLGNTDAFSSVALLTGSTQCPNYH